MKKEQMIVVAAIIEKGGKYLITQRPESKHLAKKWEFPGGKVEFGEDPKERLKQELKEELDAKTHVFNSIWDYSSSVYENENM